jgi:uncharacterized SAM-binding protein YcdF (DUF218 family)
MIDADYAPVVKPVPKEAAKTRRGVLRFWRLARLGGVLLIVLWLAGFAAFTAEVMALRQPVQAPAADAIVVLTGGKDRLAPALALLQQGKARKLLIAGVNPDTPKGDIMAAYGIPDDTAECCIAFDTVSRDTKGNAAETARWARASGIATLILVTSNYHMPRAELEFARLAGSLTVIPHPLVASDLTRIRWLERPDAIRILLTEYVKFGLAVMRHALTGAPSSSSLARIAG